MDQIIPKNTEELLSQIHSEWMRAEACIKQAEQVNNAVVIPAVKELRYAGRCLINALNLLKENPDKAREYLLDAKLDCNRARHDAVDALVSKIAIDLETTVLAAGPKAILKHFPQMPKIVNLLNTIRKKIVDSRTQNVGRDGIYAEIEQNDIGTLVHYAMEMRNSQKVLKAMARKQEFIQRMSLVFGVAGLAFGFASVLLYLFR